MLLENNGDAFKYSKNIFEIILKKFLDIDEFFKQIADENNPFIKNHFYIVENEKLKVFLEEINLQIFGFYLNVYFMKYTNKIDNAISYEGLDEEICNNIFEENLAFLKASINFL